MNKQLYLTHIKMLSLLNIVVRKIHKTFGNIKISTNFATRLRKTWKGSLGEWLKPPVC
ncbi:hypothetical protein [Prevotella sp. MGM2]|uniref:hypothetical protein n=1 Tax=Prevotella sp. MGM2 TaxID=2033406 RepID=UPI001CBBFD86|nr:hypothetical protein [Prevotella sp. MGM2]